MIRRLFWMLIGAGGAVFAIRYLSKKAEQYTPEGLTRRAEGLADSVRVFGSEVQQGMDAREKELRANLFATNAQDPRPRH